MLDNDKIRKAQESVEYITNVFNKAKDETYFGLSNSAIRKAQHSSDYIMALFNNAKKGRNYKDVTYPYSRIFDTMNS